MAQEAVRKEKGNWVLPQRPMGFEGVGWRWGGRGQDMV